MKKHFMPIIALCVLIASLMILQIGAIEPYTYFRGCNDCGNRVIAYCTGVVSVQNLSHEYGGFLGIGEEVCDYTKHIHSTREECQVYSSHENTGDNVTGYTGHVSDCGEDNIQPCDYGEEAYDSNN